MENSGEGLGKSKPHIMDKQEMKQEGHMNDTIEQARRAGRAFSPAEQKALDLEREVITGGPASKLSYQERLRIYNDSHEAMGRVQKGEALPGTAAQARETIARESQPAQPQLRPTRVIDARDLHTPAPVIPVAKPSLMQRFGNAIQSILPGKK